MSSTLFLMRLWKTEKGMVHLLNLSDSHNSVRSEVSMIRSWNGLVIAHITERLLFKPSHNRERESNFRSGPQLTISLVFLPCAFSSWMRSFFFFFCHLTSYWKNSRFGIFFGFEEMGVCLISGFVYFLGEENWNLYFF